MHKSVFIKVLALLLAAISLVVMASCSITPDNEEGESTTEPAVVLLEARPESQEQILDFFNRAVNRIKADRPGVSSSHEYSVRDVRSDDSPEAEALVAFAKSFSDALNDVNDERVYGDDLNDFLPIKGTDAVSRLTMADVKKIELNDVEDDRYAYDVVIELNDGKEYAQNAYDFNVDKSSVLTTFADYKDTLEVSDYDVSYAGCTISARINKETNQITSLRYERDALVTADVNFTGTLEPMGETQMHFTLHDSMTFDGFVWEQPTEAETEQ